MKSSPLELQFSIERLRRFLQAHPEKSAQLAIDYFEDFSILAQEHKQLQQDFQAMQTELIQLQNPKPKKFPRLPYFLH